MEFSADDASFSQLKVIKGLASGRIDVFFESFQNTTSKKRLN